MAHSISGLYSLDYVNQYPNEVSAFIGLDSSVPSLSEQKIEPSDTVPVKWFRNLGFARLQLKLSADPYEGLPYNEETKEQLTFPSDLPVLLFVQANHPVVKEWVPEHEKQIEETVY